MQLYRICWPLRSWTVQPPERIAAAASKDPQALEPSGIQVLLMGQFYVNSVNGKVAESLNTAKGIHVKAQGFSSIFAVACLAPLPET